MLTPTAEDLYNATTPHKMLGLSLGSRMTVVRLPDGGLLLHSPISLDDALKTAIDELGEVRHIVCPNAYHHVYAADAVAAYPEAKLHGPKQLFGKRRDLRFDAELSDRPDPSWGDSLVPVPIEGCLLHETVFVHPSSGTVVSSDLMENFETAEDLFTRTYLKISGIHGRIGWSRLLRPLYVRRKKARRSIDALMEHDFDRAIIAHGAIVKHDAKAAVRQTFEFL